MGRSGRPRLADAVASTRQAGEGRAFLAAGRSEQAASCIRITRFRWIPLYERVEKVSILG